MAPAVSRSALARLSSGYEMLRAGRLDEAQAIARRELGAGRRRDSVADEAHFLLAQVHWAREDGEASLASLDAAIAANPRFLRALDAKAHLLAKLQCDAEAIEVVRQLQSIAPSRAAAVLEARGLGTLGRHDEALDAVARLRQLSPAPGDWRVVAAVCGDARFALEALDAYRRAVAADPGDLRTRSSELFFANFDEGIHADELFQRHREYGALLEARVPPRFRGRWSGKPEPGRRLRLGLVSGDLGNHPVAAFLLPVLERLDRSAFEVCCYCGVEPPDVPQEALRAQCDAWTDIAKLDDEQLAARIHEDAIDVLLDLSGHTGGRRFLPVFAQRPAPVQVSWLGYLNTTGLDSIGWRLCDERTDPPATQRWHTEKLLHFAPSQWCYRPAHQERPPEDPPCAANGFVTFGSFNNAGKITDVMCARWAALMQRCPGSRMVIADVNTEAKRTAILRAFERGDVDASRLSFAPHLDVQAYARQIAGVDIALDTHPYGGGTTTLDTLWMGVPVFTLQGDIPVSRSASSVLELLGLEEWIARSPVDYEERAAACAEDFAGIARLRKELRGRMKVSPLMDEPGFTRAFEHALRSAWISYCAGTTPAPRTTTLRDPASA